MSGNPWVERFKDLDRASLKERMIHVPEPLRKSGKQLDDVAVGELRTKISAIFLSTKKVLDIAEYIVGLAKAHSKQFYPSKRDFVKRIYIEDAPIPAEYPAVNLTGPAGVGKTAMLNALVQSINAPTRIDVPNHVPVEARICWMSRMEEGLAPTNLLRNYLELDGEPEESNVAKGAQLRCRRRAYKRGISLVVTDETQFQTFSTEATAQITKTLMCLVRMGIPNLYVSNYSLGHRLAKRGQEDRDRLQSDPRILLPDTPDHEDWLWTIDEYRKLAPKIFKFDPEKLAEQMHFWTAGLKRLLGRLLMLGAEEARKTGRPVTEDVLERAYKSSSYSMSRNDTVTFHQQAKTNRQAERSRSDLWCPYELPKSDQAMQAAAARAMEQKKVIQGYMTSAMSPDERRRHKELQDAKKGERWKESDGDANSSWQVKSTGAKGRRSRIH